MLRSPVRLGNRFEAPCRACGLTVPVRGGRVDLIDGVWQAAHLDDEGCARAAEIAAEAA